MTAVRALIATGIFAAFPMLGAQEWRTIEASRALSGTDPASVRVEFGAGTIDLASTVDAVLFRMNLRYNAERSTAIANFDAGTRVASIGARSAPARGWRGKKGPDGNTMRAELSSAVPLRLTLALGTTRGEISLGGLRLTDLSLKLGASETRVDFASPNREVLSMFDLDVGAAKVTVRRGGNARAKRVRVNIGAGTLDYDLTGQWAGDMELGANVAVGSMTLRVPPDAGIRVIARTFLADVEKLGLDKRGDDWYSPGYEAAKRRVRFEVTAVLGSVEIVRQ